MKKLLKNKKFVTLAILFVAVILLVIFSFIQIPGLGKINYNEYLVTKVEGRATIKYQADFSTNPQDDRAPAHQVAGEWAPLNEGAVIAAGSGVIIETIAKSTVDLLLDDGMALRIAENSTVRLDENVKTASLIQTFVSRGKVFFNIVSSRLNRFKYGPTFKLKVSTPTVVCGIRGTVFAVDYQPESVASNVAVVEGTVSVTDPQTAQTSTGAGWYEVQGGQTIQLADGRFVEKRDLNPEEKKALSGETVAVESGATAGQRIESMKRRRGLSLFDLARMSRARYEMSSIIGSLNQQAGFSRVLPATMIDRSIPMGKHYDPWGNEYLYVQIRPNLGLVVSAGVDGTYFTLDDLFRFVSI